MAKFQEAHNRLFANVFVCKKCKQKQRSKMIKILQNKVLCRKCGCKSLRPKRKAK
jgi:ribosomal protein L40E